MNCIVTYENECGYWNWHCVPCGKKGPGFTDPFPAVNQAREHRLEVAYADVNPLEGLVP